MQKICKCAIVNGAPTPEPGFVITGAITIRFPDGDGQAWFMTARTQAEMDPRVPIVDVKDLTDAQIAADPLFPLIARVVKERRKSGPTSKRPKDLTVDDRGFCYWNTDRKAPEYWHITGKWFDAMGTSLP